MGPATDEGFYMDFEPLDGFKVSEEDFPKIEAEMQKIIKENLPIIQEEINIAEAKNYLLKTPTKSNGLKLSKIEAKLFPFTKPEQSWLTFAPAPMSPLPVISKPSNSFPLPAPIGMAMKKTKC